MIPVTRIKGQSVAINPDLIETVESTPDTTIRLVSGDTLLVRESLAEIIERVIEYRRALVSSYAVGPGRHLKGTRNPSSRYPAANGEDR
jgi:flagellar protein FlbD